MSKAITISFDLILTRGEITGIMVVKIEISGVMARNRKNLTGPQAPPQQPQNIDRSNHPPQRQITGYEISPENDLLYQELHPSPHAVTTAPQHYQSLNYH